VKIVRCTRGSVFDVIVDLRPESPTYRRWFGVELSEENGKMLYVPEGCAQGYLTLADNTEIYYHTSEFYHPESASGVRYDDPEFGIAWPGEIAVMSQQDQHWPDHSDRDRPTALAEQGERH
jgi:dTDP-4-dehydrorhamnose 3,5-epimerase